jgi:ribosome modulation factor
MTLAVVAVVAFASALAVDVVTLKPAASWDDPPPSAEALAQAESEGYAAAVAGKLSMCESPYPPMTETCKGELRQKWIKGYVAWMNDEYRRRFAEEPPTPILAGHLTQHSRLPAARHDLAGPPMSVDVPGVPDGTLPVAP